MMNLDEPERYEHHKVDVDTLHAKIVMIANEIALPNAIMANLKTRAAMDTFLQTLVVGIKSYILASGEEKVRCNVRWPADWWQAVKQRWAPDWITRRWPVRYEHHRINRTFYRAMCPHLDVPLHQGTDVHIRFLKSHE